MLLLLGYLGGLLVTFVVAVEGLLFVVQGRVPEKPLGHPRPAVVAEMDTPTSQETQPGGYKWGPRVAPGIAANEVAPNISDAVRLRKVARAAAAHPKPHAKPVSHEKRVVTKRQLRIAPPPREEEEEEAGWVALGYANGPDHPNSYSSYSDYGYYRPYRSW